MLLYPNREVLYPEVKMLNATRKTLIIADAKISANPNFTVDYIAEAIREDILGPNLA
jgi:hypothetical protein